MKKGLFKPATQEQIRNRQCDIPPDPEPNRHYGGGGGGGAGGSGGAGGNGAMVTIHMNGGGGGHGGGHGGHTGPSPRELLYREQIAQFRVPVVIIEDRIAEICEEPQLKMRVVSAFRKIRHFFGGNL